MKKIVLSLGVSAAALMLFAGKPSDKVAFTVDGRDVYLSEFEYLYNKNNSQQLQPVTFDEYVDMFVNYKLKVADALHEGMDTTASFRAEFDKFRSDLAQPYLRDSVVEEQLIEEAYGHTQKERFVSHIMLDVREPHAKAKIDSIRSLIMAGTITFEEAAKNNSVDKYSGARGGAMAWLAGTGAYPWAFEKGAYDTPIGQISEPVNSGIGWHLIRPDEERDPKGEVEVRHILVLTRGLPDSAQVAAKAKIDSIYKVVTAPGADFAEVAKKESQDPGSASNGGALDWFGPGRMVAEFDSVAFALNDGAISEPFATAYGYHIIEKLGHRGPKSLDEMRPVIKQQMEKDGRSAEPMLAMIRATAAATGAKINDECFDEVKNLLAANGGKADSTFVDQLKASEVTAFTVGQTPMPLKDVVVKVNFRPGTTPEAAEATVRRAVDNAFNQAMLNVERDMLYDSNPDYRNLVNEYRDGILLFDVSNKKVWERAANDSLGLAQYYDEHKADYNTWDKPRFKGFVVFAQNDSTLSEIQQYVDANKPAPDGFVADLKKKFGKNVKIERVVVAKGENPIIDNLGFGAPKPESPNPTWKCYFAYDYKIIDQPEEVSDVKGAVVTDYQGALERQWIDDLRKKYDVKINKKVLKKAKR